MVVELVGKTRKGKNRIKERGKMWKVLQKTKSHILVLPDNGNNDLRWIQLHDDPDFDIIIHQLETPNENI